MSTQSQIIANLIAAGFTNPSQAALYNKIAETLGDVVDSTLIELSNNRQSVLDIINNQRYGKSGYYTSVAKAFQFGDNLIIDPVTFDYVYAVIDTTKQIITQAAFAEFVSANNVQLFLKIATTDTVTGLLTPLSTAQYAAFKSYFLNFQIPGLEVSIANNPANILGFQAVATYFATYNLTVLQANIAAALQTFQKSFSFNGVFFSADLQNYMRQQVPGMRDFFVTDTTIDLIPFSGSVNMSSGYFNYTTNIINNITYSAI